MCVCVCAASGRLAVNTDLCDGSVNDFIISDKALKEKEVIENLWGLDGTEVMLGAEVPQTSCMDFPHPEPKTGLKIMRSDSKEYFKGRSWWSVVVLIM